MSSGYATAGDVEVYFDSVGAGGPVPLLLVHGGFGLTTMFDAAREPLSRGRRTVALELQGHGHTRDVPGPFDYDTFGDQVLAVADHLGLETFDLLGYSLGGGAALRAAINHPERVRRLVVVSTPVRMDDWLPEVRAGMTMVDRQGFPMLSQSPLCAAWRAVAPDPDSFPDLMDKTGALITSDYDWSGDLARITARTMLVYADHDSIPVARAAAALALLDGPPADPGWDGSVTARPRLAVLPGATHYNLLDSPLLPAVVTPFLDQDD